MGQGTGTEATVLRGALDYAADRLARIDAEISAINKYLQSSINERKALPSLVRSMKHQIKREEGKKTTKGIEAKVSEHRYIVSDIEFDVDPSTPKKKNTPPKSEE